MNSPGPPQAGIMNRESEITQSSNQESTNQGCHKGCPPVSGGVTQKPSATQGRGSHHLSRSGHIEMRRKDMGQQMIGTPQESGAIVSGFEGRTNSMVAATGAAMKKKKSSDTLKRDALVAQNRSITASQSQTSLTPSQSAEIAKAAKRAFSSFMRRAFGTEDAALQERLLEQGVWSVSDFAGREMKSFDELVAALQVPRDWCDLAGHVGSTGSTPLPQRRKHARFDECCAMRQICSTNQRMATDSSCQSCFFDGWPHYADLEMTTQQRAVRRNLSLERKDKS